jgi:hypothetical protein
MMKQNNKLEPYVQNKGIMKRLEILEQKTPSLFNIMQSLIIGIGKPMMAARAGFYRATGGVFANSRVPWFKILLILSAAYILMYKNLNFNFNLNSPQGNVPNTSSMNVAQNFSPTGDFLFDDDANIGYVDTFKGIAITERT